MRGLPARNRRRLLAGVAFVAMIFVAQGAIGSLVSRRANTSAVALSENAISSVEKLTQISRDAYRERILVDEHIFETAPADLAEVERRIDVVRHDRREAEQDYAPLVNLPGEAELWSQLQGLLARFDQDVERALSFSRKNQDREARAQLAASAGDYVDLDDALSTLLMLNQAGANDAVRQITDVQRRSEGWLWVTRVLGLLALLVFGFWGARRIGAYEDQLMVYAATLEDRNRDLDAFAGRVAHDLKNALGPMVVAAPLLRRSPGNVMEIADRIERSASRANSVVEALLAFSRSSSGAAADETAALAPALRSVDEELAPLASQVGASVEMEEIPDVQLRIDPGLLHIVLANLCGNAVKYLQGQEERRVSVRARAEDGSCRVEVEDTGPGIPVAAQSRIFEPFFRVQGNSAPGTGLGLATVRRILDARGGRIQVESAPGRGSRFTFWLPLA